MNKILANVKVDVNENANDYWDKCKIMAPNEILGKEQHVRKEW
jgi:hypothetical protein